MDFLLLLVFSPQLVAGPIERASNLLPQFEKERVFDYDKAADGMRQILWGLFKKIIIADTCAKNVNYIFGHYTELNGFILFLGAFFFAFQIYGDFSGYSDIAIGTSRLFGFNLMRNFACPYFSRDIAEFWRRWHISLSSWFRDYVYIPLGGSRGGKNQHIRNLIITFTISGLWHGANWTFIFWGFLNGLYYLPLMLRNKQKEHTSIVAENTMFPSWIEVCQMAGTFIIVLIAWVFFRAESISKAVYYLYYMFVKTPFQINILELTKINSDHSVSIAFIGILFLLIIEWIQRKEEHGLSIRKHSVLIRWVTYPAMFLLVCLLGNFSAKYEFIYFQF